MDEWRTRLAEQLLGEKTAVPEESRATFAPDGPTAMEIAFGRARSELTYLLELGRSHHLPVAGNVVGDEVWVRLGEHELRFHFDRETTSIASSVAGKSQTMTWDPKIRAVVTSGGKAVDVEWLVREAIDQTVNAFRATKT